MNMIDAIRSAFSKYATFSGRARRSEYWFFYLFLILTGWVIGLIVMGTLVFQIFSGSFGDIEHVDDPVPFMIAIYTSPAMWLVYIWGLVTLLPKYSTLVRRLHDIGKSGWFYLIYVIITMAIYFMGIFAMAFGAESKNIVFLSIGVLLMFAVMGLGIYLLVLLCTDSQKGPNKYGPNPKGIGNEEATEVTDV